LGGRGGGGGGGGRAVQLTDQGPHVLNMF